MSPAVEVHGTLDSIARRLKITRSESVLTAANRVYSPWNGCRHQLVVPAAREWTWEQGLLIGGGVLDEMVDWKRELLYEV